MDPAKARLYEAGGKIISSLLRVAVTRYRKSSTETTKEPVESSKPAVAPQPYRSSGIALPTSEETTLELKARLRRELNKLESDLVGGLMIAGRPCDCFEDKHIDLIESKAEELISQDPSNSVPREVIQWIKDNQYKGTIEAIQSGKYVADYPYMANDLKKFRKRLMGRENPTESEAPTAKIIPIHQAQELLTLDEAKKLAAEEAAKEVERKWHSVEKK